MFTISNKRFCSVTTRYVYVRRLFCDESKDKLEVKNTVSGALSSAYDPKSVESKWYEFWQAQKYFTPEDPLLKSSNTSKIFSLIIPPPNVTGVLHLGHALTVAIQDTIVRWNRMVGNKVLWVPGYDHAGIATQIVVEKKLWNERKLSRREIGKEEFLKEVMQWKDSKIQNIYEQFCKLGCMLDFTRTVFTMDSKMSKAVTEAFVQLFDQGLIYRKERFVHWSCALQSAIADFEVEHVCLNGRTMLNIPGMKEPVEFGIIDQFAYPVLHTNDHIVVSTTRLETMLGDTAIAIHPKDSRYQHFIGQFAVHPFTGENLPIIADDSVDASFGSGALKVTPAHSQIDFEIAQRHNLPFREVFDDSGKIKQNYSQFSNLPRYTARKLICQALKEKGLYYGNKDHVSTIPMCSRSGDVIEPRLKFQWYLNCSSMAKKVSLAAKNGDLKFSPERYQIIWLEWLKNIQDWCVSRQLWWGHQIPAYRIRDNSSGKEIWLAARDKEEAIDKGSKKLNVPKTKLIVQQDEDVLDTWFSSALIPLSVHGWPDKLSDFYPLSLMETGDDIIFYWVARMVMMGEHFTGKLPFHNVLLHGILCDSLGRKMSKSLGNVVNPTNLIYGASLQQLKEDVKASHKIGYLTEQELKLSIQGQVKNFPQGIPECGTDGLRFALLSHNFKSELISIDIKHIRSCRNFCNKIWQSVRFFDMVIDKFNPDFKPKCLSTNKDECTDTDQWILSCLASTVDICNKSFATYDLYIAATALQKFWIQGFCDVYIESIKPTVYSNEKDHIDKVCNIMFACIETFLRLISPFMPFLSEELYQHLSCKLVWNWSRSICITPYPKESDWEIWINVELENHFKSLLELIHAIRSMKTFYGMAYSKPIVIINLKNGSLLEKLENFNCFIITLCGIKDLKFQLCETEHCENLKNLVSQIYNDNITILMQLPGTIEEQKLFREKKCEKIQKELEKLNRIMSHKNYPWKVHKNIRDMHIEKKANLERELHSITKTENLS